MNVISKWMSTALFLLLIMPTMLRAADGSSEAKPMAVLPPHPWGVYTWLGGDKNQPPAHMPIKGVPLLLHWSSLEPREGEFSFEQEVRAPLERARDRNQYVHMKLWVAPDRFTPPWLFDKGVPRVKVPERISPTRQKSNLAFPYYLNPTYKACFHRTIQALGDHLAGLPKDLKSRIVFIQSAEGSTGDGGPYKGTHLDARFTISREQWGAFRRETWSVYQKAFQRADGSLQLPLLVNGDANGEAEYTWLLDHCDVFGLKQGMFSHGYLVSDTRERLEKWERFRAKAKERGKVVFSRGEQDAEWKICGWSKHNPPQAFYWSALFALHCKLDLWNVPVDALTSQPLAKTVAIFNRHAGHNDAAGSPAAFCALRRGLDASDTTAFPEAEFGTAKKSNRERYLAIAKAFSSHGARQGDPDKAMGGGMVNRQADDQNDVGWGILPGNFERHLTQLTPESTSMGLWHVGPDAQPFSLFARRFDAATGRTTMHFQVAAQFFEKPAEPYPSRLRVVYLDQGNGSWALLYANPSGERTALQVTLTNSGEWKEKQVTVPDAVWDHRLAGGSDLALRHVNGVDTIFHLVEIERLDTPSR